MIQKLFNLIFTHKIISVAIVTILAGGFYFIPKFFKQDAHNIKYTLTTAKRETITAFVSGSGQVLASNQINIKSKVSGDVIFIGAKSGDAVKAGQLLVQLDAREAQKLVRDAEISLENAQLSYKKLIQPPDALTILQAENSLIQAKELKKRYEDDLIKSYDDGFNTVSNAFLDLPSIMSGLQDLLLGTSFNSVQTNMDYYSSQVKMYDQKAVQYQDDAYRLYQKARASYDKNFEDYKKASRFSSVDIIEKLISQTYDTTKDIAEAVKSANNFIQFYKDKLLEQNSKPHPLADTHLNQLNTYTGKTNSHLLNLLGIKNTIQNSKENILSTERSIIEKEALLEKLKKGPDQLDIESQRLALKQKESALIDAKEKLSDYFIYAPFSGIIVKIDIKKGDTVPSGSTIAILISPQKMAEITLNEVDVSKVKIGQKATLNFDAVPNLSITGEVAEIDSIGTVSQGVASYNVKINFDTQDDRIKPGMTVSANIITDIRQNVLVIPNSALKTQGNAYFVEIPDTQEETSLQSAQNLTNIILKKPTLRKQVEIGIANDQYTEIISGLDEGSLIISGTFRPTTNNSNIRSGPSFRIPGLQGGGFR